MILLKNDKLNLTKISSLRDANELNPATSLLNSMHENNHSIFRPDFPLINGVGH